MLIGLKREGEQMKLLKFFAFIILFTVSFSMNNSPVTANTSITSNTTSTAILIRNILISGNTSISSASILGVISSKTNEEINTENILSDINAIYEIGCFNDSVGAETILVSKNKVDLVYSVKENPIVKQIYFVGLHSFTPEQLMVSLNVKQGKLLNYADLRKDIQCLNDFYHDRGYVLMNVKEISEPQDDNVLTFVIKEGIIEDIFLKGLTNTKEFVVTREMETKPGAAFNLNTLQDDIRSVYNTGYFETINPDPPMAGIDPEKVVVVMNLQEKRSGSFQFGGGIGSSTGFFGFLKLEFINFLGQGYNVSAKGQWGEKQLTYEFRYHNPWQWPDRTYLDTRIWNTDGQIDEGTGLYAHNVGGEITVGKALTKQISGFTTLRANNVTPQDAAISSYQVRSLGGGLSYDTRDYIFNPSNGDYIVANANTSLKMIGASIEFLKYRIRYFKFFPLGKDLAFGLKTTFDDSFGTIFDTERYFMGGATTLRGYKDGSPVAIGGRRFLGSLELRYNLNPSMQLYLFYDYGKTVKGYSSSSFYGDSAWRTGKGIGFKLSTPIGPLRFDYAWGDGVIYNDGYDSSQGVVHFNFENSF